MTEDGLTAPDIVMLIEALDALIPGHEGSTTWLKASPEEQERWEPYRRLSVS